VEVVLKIECRPEGGEIGPESLATVEKGDGSPEVIRAVGDRCAREDDTSNKERSYCK
jgi:hypothetical protein